MTSLKEFYIDWLSRKNEERGLKHSPEDIERYAEILEDSLTESQGIILEAFELNPGQSELPQSSVGQFMGDFMSCLFKQQRILSDFFSRRKPA